VNQEGKTVVLAFGLFSIKCRETYEWFFKKYLESLDALEVKQPQSVFSSFQSEILEAKEKIFIESKNLVSQFYFIQSIKELTKNKNLRTQFRREQNKAGGDRNSTRNRLGAHVLDVLSANRRVSHIR